MATTAHAIKALTKAGALITVDGNRVRGLISNHAVEFYDQEGRVICLRTRRITDHDDSLSDYSAGSWMRNITHAIATAQKFSEQDKAEVASGRLRAEHLGLSAA